MVLLHGWPGGAPTWETVAPLLHCAGLRTLVPDQRGYSPGARPRSAVRYDIDSLAGDVLALLDAAGLASAHLVGHDWGGAVAWRLAGAAPDRLKSLTVLSTPHPAAFAGSLLTSGQILRSAYIGVFQLPFIPEQSLSADGGAVLSWMLQRSGLDRTRADAYGRRLSSPEAVGASLAWYRALLRTRGGMTGPSQVPTLYVWSSGDSALGRTAAEQTGAHVEASYRFEILEGVPHWIPELAAETAAQLIISQVRP